MTTTALDPATVRVKLTQLCEDFFARIDRTESTADLWTDDAEFGPTRGRADVVEALLERGRKRTETGRTTRHYTSTLTFDELADNRFRVRSITTSISYDTRPAESGELLIGDADDVVVFAADGTCRFQKRSVAKVMKFALTPEA